MGEDFRGDGGIFDVGDDAHAAAAPRACEDVEIEGAAHERRPRHARGAGEELAAEEATDVAIAQDVRRSRHGDRWRREERELAGRIGGTGDEGRDVGGRWCDDGLCIAGGDRLARRRRRGGASSIGATMVVPARVGFVRRSRHDRAPPLRVRSEHAVVADERVFRRRDERCEPRQKLGRRHHPMGRAAARVLHAVRDLAVGEHADAIEREGRTSAVAHEFFAADVVALADADGRVHVEAVGVGGVFGALFDLVFVVGGDPSPARIEPHERAGRDRELGAGVEGVGLVGVVFVGRIEQASFAEPAEHAIADIAGDELELGARGRRGWMERRRAVGGPA